MPDISLPLPDGRTAFLRPTLALVEVLERDGESLFSRAERLSSGKVGLSEVVRTLKTLYTAANVALREDELEDFLLRATPVAPAVILAEALLTLLVPLRKMGAFRPGEP